jgi:hypothetical protein
MDFAGLQKTIHTSYRISSRTYLPDSTLDTPYDFCFLSIRICEPYTGYTELAFERVWLTIIPSPVRREIGSLFPGRKKTHGTERRSWPGSQFKQASK